MILREQFGGVAPRSVVLASALAGCIWALAADAGPHAPIAAAGCLAAGIWACVRPLVGRVQAQAIGLAASFGSALMLVGVQGGAHSPFVPVWLAIVAGEGAAGERAAGVAAAEALLAVIGVSFGGVHLATVPLLGGFGGLSLGTFLAVRHDRTELRRARRQAEIDHLTGLSNRWAIDRYLDRLLATEGQRARLSIFAVDLDDFRAVNRERGHDAGDRAIVAAAERLQEAVPEAAIARLGGDEFLVVVDGKFDPPTVARHLGETIAVEPVEGRRLTASIGIASAPEHGHTREQLRKAADDALRAAKGAGKSREVVYSGDRWDVDPRASVSALWLEDRIRIAVQPLVDLQRGTIRGYEALARFAVTGDASPQRWFRLAERAGLRAELEIACLRAALERAKERPSGSRFSVNLSPDLLDRGDVRELLEAEGDLSGFVLELTENGVVEDYERLQVLLEPFYERGLRLAVDDFGAGRANMHHVSALRPRYLKIDRSLVSDLDRDPQKVALIEALAGYAERIGSYLIAEGVERRGELEQLTAAGVTLGQGYYLAPPGDGWPQLGVDIGTPRRTLRVETSSDALIEPVAADVPAMTLYERLAEEASLLGFAVVDNHQRVLGLITRNALLLKLSMRFGFSLYGHRPALQVADREFVSARPETPRDELITRALGRPRPSRFDPIVIVDESERMVSYLTMESLLEESAFREPLAAVSAG